MRKSTLFISAVLTTFMLAILFGVVTQYKARLDATVQAESTTAVVEVLPTETATLAPTQLAALTPEQAAMLVAQILGRSDLLSVETSTFNNASAYLVKFTNGDQAYVSPEGIILSVVMAPPPVVVVSGSSSRNNDGPQLPRNFRPGGGGGGGGDDDGGGGGDGDDD